MSFELPALPYAEDALAPHISAKTLQFHHGKHHASYVKKLNGLVDQKGLSGSLEDIIQASANNGELQGVFNNAAQVWNHTFYWNSMRPDGGGEPKGQLANMIDNDFGSFSAFRDEFTRAAADHFGSGWAWLVVKEGRLSIETTSDADLPLAHEKHALLTCDLWEHAYYLDFQNRRPDYLGIFLDHLVNWEFAEANLAKAKIW